METRFWLPDPQQGYVASRLLEKKTIEPSTTKSNSSIKKVWRFQVEDNHLNQKVTSQSPGQIVELPEDLAKSLGHVTDEQLLGESNICNLSTISEGALLATVRARFERKEIYTHVARIVLAVNPFEELPIYTPEYVDRYAQGGGSGGGSSSSSSTSVSTQGQSQGNTGNSDATPAPITIGSGGNPGPHVYGIGSDAFHGLMTNRVPQSVLISGESGAGKTESTKHVLSYFADVASPSVNVLNQTQQQDSDSGNGNTNGSDNLNDNYGQTIENKILSTNPVLEALGNAKTVRNNNSSRFGKWIQVLFNQTSMEISGGKITDYLLETTRVVGQAAKERNYHIFYQILENPDILKKDNQLLKDGNANSKDRNLVKPSEYEYLKHSCSTADGINDQAGWRETEESFLNIGFTEEQVRLR